MERIIKNKAGEWVCLPQEYTAFIPKGLPIGGDGDLDLSDAVYRELKNTKEELLKFEGRIFLKEFSKNSINLFYKFFMLREAIFSSRIEDIETSKEELFKAERLNIVSDFLQNDVYNNYLALKHAFAISEKLPLSQRFFKKTQEVLLRNPDKLYCTPGAFRTTQNWIGTANSTILNALYVPPPAGEIQRLLFNLEKYINEEKAGLDPLIKAAIIHSQFELIHPFLDGNGRTGRIINSIYFEDNKICDAKLFILSETLFRNLSEYYKNLQLVHEQGDWNSWVLFFLAMVRETARSSGDLLLCLVNLYKANEDRVRHYFEENSKQDAVKLLESFAKEIVLEFGKEAVKTSKIRYLLSKFQEFGIIKKVDKNVYKYIEIFNLL